MSTSIWFYWYWYSGAPSRRYSTLISWLSNSDLHTICIIQHYYKSNLSMVTFAKWFPWHIWSCYEMLFSQFRWFAVCCIVVAAFLRWYSVFQELFHSFQDQFECRYLSYIKTSNIIELIQITQNPCSSRIKLLVNTTLMVSCNLYGSIYKFFKIAAN